MQDISDEVRLLEHIVLSKFPGQATYLHRIWWMTDLRDDFRGENNCLEPPKNVSGNQLSLWVSSVVSETISIININNEEKNFSAPLPTPPKDVKLFVFLNMSKFFLIPTQIGSLDQKRQRF